METSVHRFGKLRRPPFLVDAGQYRGPGIRGRLVHRVNLSLTSTTEGKERDLEIPLLFTLSNTYS